MKEKQYRNTAIKKLRTTQLCRTEQPRIIIKFYSSEILAHRITGIPSTSDKSFPFTAQVTHTHSHWHTF